MIDQGIADLPNGRETIPALLVSIGAEPLRAISMSIPEHAFQSPEQRLYELLRSEDSDAAKSRYNALIGKLVSLERAAEREYFARNRA